MSDEKGNKGISRAVWLLMLREGGRWRPPELSKSLSQHMDGSTLTAMVNTGALRRFPLLGKKGSEYGVTLGCKVPIGVTLKDLVEAGALHVKHDEPTTGDQT